LEAKTNHGEGRGVNFQPNPRYNETFWFSPKKRCKVSSGKGAPKSSIEEENVPFPTGGKDVADQERKLKGSVIMPKKNS